MTEKRLIDEHLEGEDGARGISRFTCYKPTYCVDEWENGKIIREWDIMREKEDYFAFLVYMNKICKDNERLKDILFRKIEKRFKINVADELDENAIFCNDEFICLVDDTDNIVKVFNYLVNENERLKCLIHDYKSREECNKETIEDLHQEFMNVKDQLKQKSKHWVFVDVKNKRGCSNCKNNYGSICKILLKGTHDYVEGVSECGLEYWERV